MRLNTVNLSLLLTCTMCVGVAYAESDRIYLEEDGRIVFDVEDAEPAEGWVLKTELDDFKGSGYFEWTGRNSFPVDTAGRGAMTYRIRIETAGNYQLRWRSRIAIGDLSTEHNDSWVRLATGQDIVDEHPLNGWTKNYMNQLGEWSWDSRTVDNVGHPIRQYFSEGDHTIEISGRSAGHALDRIALYMHEDYGFNPSTIGDWELSEMIMDDGSTTDPGDDTPPPADIELENLEIVTDTWQEQPTDQCVANTLSLAAADAAMYNPAGAIAEYSAGEYLSVASGSSVALLKFDLSLVPPATSAKLEYSTNDQPSNGTVVYSLGSHSNWPGTAAYTTAYPDMMLELSQAAGGWEAEGRHRSDVPADFLSSAVHTIIINSQDQSDPLTFYAQLSSELTPRLILTGDDAFCDNWQANVDASNIVVDPPEEEVEEEVVVEVAPPVVPEKDNASDKDETSEQSSSGGSLSWLLMMVLAGTAAIRKKKLTSV